MLDIILEDVYSRGTGSRVVSSRLALARLGVGGHGPCFDVTRLVRPCPPTRRHLLYKKGLLLLASCVCFRCS